MQIEEMHVFLRLSSTDRGTKATIKWRKCQVVFENKKSASIAHIYRGIKERGVATTVIPELMSIRLKNLKKRIQKRAPKKNLKMKMKARMNQKMKMQWRSTTMALIMMAMGKWTK